MPKRDFVAEAETEDAPIQPAERLKLDRRIAQLEGSIRERDKRIDYLVNRLEQVDKRDAEWQKIDFKLYPPVAVQRPASRRFERWAVVSDLHSQFLDARAWAVFLQVWQDNKWDGIVFNGDTCDFPTISQYSTKIRAFRPEILRQWDLDDELDFVRENIFRPVHKAKPRVPKQMRRGNHEDRFIWPNACNASALAEILKTSRHANATRLEDMLKLKQFNCELSYNAVDYLHDTFALIHGVSTALIAPRHNLDKYGCGTSGHTHRVGVLVKRFKNGRQSWYESGCFRTLDNIEYLPHGENPNWTHAFLEVLFDKLNPHWYACNPHLIINGACEFHGVRYAV